MIIAHDEDGRLDFVAAGRAIGHAYVLACDTVSGRLVRVLRGQPMPPGCFKVLNYRLKRGGWDNVPHDVTTGQLKPPYWSVRRWHEQPHARQLLRSDSASIGAGRAPGQ